LLLLLLLLLWTTSLFDGGTLSFTCSLSSADVQNPC